ncbi:MAG: 1,4-alpha-glucan branching protein domain-containing protein [Candidatus Krumholzibacteriota bacterium]|nr:1,4-alpha-glucan branching protein domain-containing protein [Candidatus Krumholzibacteriota bacterium]
MTNGHKGYLSLVLHAHLPYVRHPEHARFLEEDWFYEALTETYIPLLDMFNRLKDEGVDFRFTISLTPTLLSMLADPLLQNRYIRHLDSLIELTRKEMTRTRWMPDLLALARMYHDNFIKCRGIFAEKYHKDLISAFRFFQNEGNLEILTCGATHAFMPLVKNRKAADAQIRIAVDQYKNFFGKNPAGIWLAECGYTPGLEEILKANGIKYFFTDSHGILNGEPRPRYGVFAPVSCPNGVALFGRDNESSKQVWSAKEGYPGDYQYRDFYRDVGFDLDYDYIKPYLHGDGNRISLGIKYYRITGKGEEKQIYDPSAAAEKAALHAGNFMFNREKQIEHLEGFLGTKPIVVSPYDAELFGHWWYEGPLWLEHLMRKLHYDQNSIVPVTPSEYLRARSEIQVVKPSMSSWGYKGYNEVWLNGSNDWVYPHLHIMEDRMVELAGRFPSASGLPERALNQAARELLLAQSSDWAFIMKTGTMVEYAHSRTKSHISRFDRLYHSILSSRINESWLKEIERRDNIFPNIDYKVYSSTENQS